MTFSSHLVVNVAWMDLSNHSLIFVVIKGLDQSGTQAVDECNLRVHEVSVRFVG